MAGSRRTWRSKADGLNAAKPFYGCKNCGRVLEEKIQGCRCGSAQFWRLASKAEAARFAELVLLQHAQQIEKLECQRRCPIKINGILVTTYIADFVYRDRQRAKWIYEDVKPKGFQTDISKVKIALFDAVMAPLGYKVDIIHR